MAQLLDLTIQPVACRAGLVAHVQPAMARCQLLDRPRNARRRVLDLADKSDLPRATTLGNRYRVLRLRHIKSHKCSAMIPHGPPSVHEARLGQPEQPSHYCTKGRTAGLSPGT